MKKNHAGVFVFCGAVVYSGLGFLIGFFSTTALVCVAWGWLLRRKAETHFVGTALTIASLVCFVGAITIDSEKNFFMIWVIIVCAFFLMNWKKKPDNVLFFSERTGEHEAWQVTSIKRRFVAGEWYIDFSHGVFQKKETCIEARIGLGQIVCIVPSEVEVTVMATVGIGELCIADQQLSGLGNSVLWQSPRDFSAQYRLNIQVECFVGTVRVQVRS